MHVVIKNDNDENSKKIYNIRLVNGCFFTDFITKKTILKNVVNFLNNE